MVTTNDPRVPGQDAHLIAGHPDAWRNPTPARCYHLAIIGAGPAGLAAAERARASGAKVALIERGRLGGVCLNTGCIPSKSIVRTARLYAGMREAQRYGAQVPDVIAVDFAAAMARVRRIRRHLESADWVHRLRSTGVDLFCGDARFGGRDWLMVDGQRLHFDNALIATGARPEIPEIPGLAQTGFMTNENVFDLTQLPPRLLVIGGGPLGCELAQAFCRLGARTTIVQDMPLFLGNEERDAAQILSDAFARDGIEVRLNTTVEAVRRQDGEIRADLVSADYRNTIAIDAILIGAGHAPQLDGLNLAAAGIGMNTRGGVEVDDFLRTENRQVYAAGDACLEHKYTNSARASAQIAVGNALFGGRQRLSKLIVPWCTFTDPEIAHVGLYVGQANRQGIPVKTFTLPMHQIDRAVTDSEAEGFVKIHVRERSDTILGATIVARHAGDMLGEITLAMTTGIGLRTLARIIQPYPTQADAIRQAAEAYVRTRTRARAPLRWRFRQWLAT
ncbi:mercuric reductase [Oleiagrimonas sp.]|jgi:pyruvate/2-oxoglutarate dehydrogenase complex dihydrolipoamide dehydrogenase (E3) component|uniref:mercuric reductase n=1 Tax=Oleiagrimonas sp. TaxID=2010330 RepID=UPI002608759F|nr:mercuric reductase [Oleiagrimonas sp.]MDA3913753.1 mercuric reductase [Oleiagrimonas sp.]